MLPTPFLDLIQQIIPEKWLDSVLSSFKAEKDVSFFVNSLIANPQDTLTELSHIGLSPKPILFEENTFSVSHTDREKLTTSEAFNQGRIYICTPSSLLPPRILNPKQGEVVLDLAAAPGGKTIRLAQLMANQGNISAVEPIRNRFFRLNANLKKYGVNIAKTYLKDGRAVGKLCPCRFDKVLLDAPCSSEARFKAFDPKSWQHWSARKVKEMAHKQVGLLRSAVESTKIEGEILYCTCSFSPEENELIIDKTLQAFQDKIDIMPIILPQNLQNYQQGIIKWDGKELDTRLCHSVRILPDNLMDGLFMCKIKVLN